MSEKPILRRFSLEDDFMNFKTNDLLYGFMRGLSTAHPTGKYNEKGQMLWQEYLPIKTFKKNKKVIAGICGITPKQIGNQVEKMLDVGLLDIEVIQVNVNDKLYEYESYLFPYDEDGRYKKLDCEVVKYLVNTRNANAIRIYLYLLNKYEWKKDYVFTIGEIKDALGYAKSTKTADEMIKHCLASFKAEGLIKYEKVIVNEEVGDSNTYKVVPVERMKLKYVIASGAELPNF